MSELHEYAFDLILNAAVRVKASSLQEARAMIAAAFDCADCNFGAWPNGDPITGEASVNGNMSLFEVNGISLDAESSDDEMIGEGDRFRLFENRHGFRLLRLDDGAQATWYGDDACEEFRDRFTGDESPDDPKDNASATDAIGLWAEEQGQF